MKKSPSTSPIEETKPVFSCEFCKRVFLREKTIFTHICEGKHRWAEKDKQGPRIGFQSWLQFYAKNSMGKKNRTQEEFIKSAYYTAFIKFGTYCAGANVINVSRYTDWLLKEQIRIDSWNQDTNYTKFLIEYIRIEDPMDALARSIETTIKMAETERILAHDILRYGNPNKICYQITLGKISPWMLYQSDSGTQFLSTLNEDCVKIVIDYINPEQWAIKFKRDPETANVVKGLLKQAGY